MRPLLILFTLGLTAMTSTSAMADNWRYGRSYDNHRGYYSSNRHSYSGWNNRYRSSGRYYGNHYSRFDYPRRGSYVSVAFGDNRSWRRHGYSGGHFFPRSRRHYGSHDAASFVGGLVVGGLISSSINRGYRDSYSAPVVRSRVISEPTIVRSSRAVSAPSRAPVSGSSRTRLLRDLQGDCFEISYAPDGTEQRAQLGDEECGF